MLRWIAAKCIAPKVKFSFNNDDPSYYNSDTDSINICVEENCEDFLAHVRQYHDFHETQLAQPLVWIMLHEIGHHYTLVEDDEEDSLRMILKMAFEVEETDRKIAYYNLPNEWKATEWAINYIKKHRVFVKILNWLVARPQH